MRIDSHHHFWKYNPIDYAWIDGTMKAIQRDFLPEHLQSEIRKAGISGVVSVQARQSEQETAWLLKLAEETDFIKGVVGWLPLTNAGVESYLEKYTHQSKLVGLRHVVQAEADDNFILRSDFNRGIIWISRFNLRYDILIFERHLPQTIEFVTRHPKQTFILDHIAKPKIFDRELEPWRSNIRELARRDNVFCKLSGLVTEANWLNWTSADLRPYFDTILEAFGPRRIMFGSDWPVCLVASAYQKWVDTVEDWIAKLSPSEKSRIMGETAVEAYGLK